MRHRSNGKIDTCREESLPSLRGLLGLHGDERRARPLPSIPREDKFATHIEFVRRDQVELLWFPKPVGMWMMGEHVFAAARCGHAQRMRPRIETSVSDYRKHAR